MLIASDEEDKSVLCVARVLLLFYLNFETDGGQIGYAISQYMDCTLGTRGGK